MSENKKDVTLSARGITKRYGSQVVLEDADLDVRSGEILALIGENGAGKSTLMRILAGATRPDSGTIDFQGKRVTVGSVRQAQALGIAMIFQELNLVPSRTVAQNIYIGREPVVRGPRGRFGVVDRMTLREQAGARPQDRRIEGFAGYPPVGPERRPAAAGRDRQGRFVRRQGALHG